MLFSGSGVAIITPFNKDFSLNYELFGKLLEFHVSNKTDAIIVCGTTGESATLTHKEQEDLIDFTVKQINGRIPVIAGTGSNETERAIRLTQFAEKSGADGALVVTPYYNKTSQRGLYEHYKIIAGSTSLPIIMYNVPSRTSLNMSAKTAVELSKIKNIVATKEAGSNIVQIAEIARDADPDFCIYSGNDNETIPILSLGAKGVISVAANIIPGEMSRMVHLYLEGETGKSTKLFLEYLPVMNDLFIDVNPVPVKYAMELLGHPAGPCRMPLTGMEPENKETLKNTLEKANVREYEHA